MIHAEICPILCSLLVPPDQQLEHASCTCHTLLFRRLEGASEFGSSAWLWTRSRRDVSIAARLILRDVSIGDRPSSLPTCSAIVASDRDCSLRTLCSLLSRSLQPTSGDVCRRARSRTAIEVRSRLPRPPSP